MTGEYGPQEVVAEDLTWQISKESAGTGACVELASLPNGGVAVRNSTDPEGPILRFTRPEVLSFLGGLADGSFDNLDPRATQV